MIKFLINFLIKNKKNKINFLCLKILLKKKK